MKKIPIYTADIKMIRFQKKGSRLSVTESIDEVVLKNIVVKGFSIKDIIERNSEKLTKKAEKIKKLGKNQFYQASKVLLLKQHGYGL